jgi:ABC-type transporter Mla subunit MlaD
VAKKKLNELFDEVRNRNLNEDFQVGQAAQALQELKRSAKEFSEFLDGPFTKIFKQMHNDPRNIEGAVADLSKALQQQLARMSNVVEEMDAYLNDVNTYLNPESIHHGKQHEDRMKHRWARWEQRTPRHLDRDGE